MTIRDRVKELCRDQHISINRLEQEVGLSKGYVSKLGESVPNTKKISLIADRLNVSVDYLVNGTLVEIMPKTDQEKWLLEHFRRLSEVGKAEVKGFIQGKEQED